MEVVELITSKKIFQVSFIKAQPTHSSLRSAPIGRCDHWDDGMAFAHAPGIIVMRKRDDYTCCHRSFELASTYRKKQVVQTPPVSSLTPCGTGPLRERFSKHKSHITAVLAAEVRWLAFPNFVQPFFSCRQNSLGDLEMLRTGNRRLSFMMLRHLSRSNI